ncbi:hypothetical protein EVG20_g1498 [Dentipellis fragilis]|uniref:DUF6533 domain-containing protein n=1 Tax=Dentipellis fragilis TaxID=205917 RepID=A0A4Y9ZDN1_9AGAM|nr:hypothetical protein EVG20_g1498 [Dentipellis fragilis]
MISDPCCLEILVNMMRCQFDQGTTTRIDITMDTSPKLGALLGVTVTKYFSAFTATVAVWDTCLNMGNEIRLIWCRPFTRAKFLYLILRYTTVFFQIFQSFGSYSRKFSMCRRMANESSIKRFSVRTEVRYTFAASLDHAKLKQLDSCKHWIVTTVVGGLTSLALANFVLIQQVYVLWDHRPRILQTLFAAFFVTYMSSMIVAIVSLRRMLGTVLYDSETFHVCLITSKPIQWVAGWVSQVVFDVCVSVFTFLNAASRPRLLDDKIVSELLRDGAVSYAVFSGLRLINAVLCAFKNPAFLAPGFLQLRLGYSDHFGMPIAVARRTLEAPAVQQSGTDRLKCSQRDYPYLIPVDFSMHIIALRRV